MVDFLIECGVRSVRPAIVQAVMPSQTAKYESDQRVMMELVTQSNDPVCFRRQVVVTHK